MHALGERKILGSRQREPRRRDPLDRRVVGQVHEENRPVYGTRLLHVGDEEIGFLEGNAHRAEYDGEFLFCTQHLCLACDLRGDAVVRESRAGENGEFLAAHERVEAVDGRETRLNELAGIGPRRRIVGVAVDISSLLGDYLGPAVYGPAESVEDPPEHVR